MRREKKKLKVHCLHASRPITRCAQHFLCATATICIDILCAHELGPRNRCFFSIFTSNPTKMKMTKKITNHCLSELSCSPALRSPDNFKRSGIENQAEKITPFQLFVSLFGNFYSHLNVYHDAFFVFICFRRWNCASPSVFSPKKEKTNARKRAREREGLRFSQVVDHCLHCLANDDGIKGSRFAAQSVKIDV